MALARLEGRAVPLAVAFRLEEAAPEDLHAVVTSRWVADRRMEAGPRAHQGPRAVGADLVPMGLGIRSARLEAHQAVVLLEEVPLGEGLREAVLK